MIRYTSAGYHCAVIPSTLPAAAAFPPAPDDSAAPVPLAVPVRFEHCLRTGSTNADLLAQPFDGAPAGPRLLWADEQTAGRGRRGRVWQSNPRDSLTFSLAIETAVRAADRSGSMAGFSLAVGVCLAQALERSAAAAGPIRLKWPNDLILGEGKVGGVLIEVREHAGIQRMVIGCGINLRAQPIGSSDEAVEALPSAGLLAPDHPGLSSEQAGSLVMACAQGLVRAHHDFRLSGLQTFRQRWLARDFFADRPIVLTDARRQLASGRNAGIDADGALLVDDGRGVRAFAIGDVSARPMVGPNAEPSAGAPDVVATEPGR